LHPRFTWRCENRGGNAYFTGGSSHR